MQCLGILPQLLINYKKKMYFHSGKGCYVRAQSCPTVCNPMDCSLPGSSVHGIFQARSTGVGYHFLLQGIFLTQGLNVPLLRLLLWQVDSLPLVPPGKPLRGDGGPHLTYMALENK